MPNKINNGGAIAIKGFNYQKASIILIMINNYQREDFLIIPEAEDDFQVYVDGKTIFIQVKGEKRFDPIRIEHFLREKGIALCSSAQTAIREHGNASDKFLKIIDPVDLDSVLKQVPLCRWIFTTGGKATETLLGLLPEKTAEPKTNEYIPFPYLKNRELFLYRLPSTSRAYPLSLVKKAEAYYNFFKKAGMI